MFFPYVINNISSDFTIIFLEPIKGDSLQSKTYFNEHLTSEKRYTNLNNFYSRNEFTFRGKSYLLFEQYNQMIGSSCININTIWKKHRYVLY